MHMVQIKQQSPVAPNRLTEVLEHKLSWVNTHFVGCIRQSGYSPTKAYAPMCLLVRKVPQDSLPLLQIQTNTAAPLILDMVQIAHVIYKCTMADSIVSVDTLSSIVEDAFRWVVTYCSRTQVRQVFLSLDHLINCPVRNGIGALIQYTNEEMERVEVEDQHIIDECDQLIPGKTATELHQALASGERFWVPNVRHLTGA
ncbi:hypothetical protein UY3_12368 [Chelonia mydas]|uniref:Uncharacterized protein n=1 Tax=Chelonia mydas TaxID=8469 RepID=M7B0D4_CHEMY|nr:hypothetical protein UY3_12368 [Chelonia mydas]